MPREAFTYQHSDIPPGMTLAEWRGMRTSQRRDAEASPALHDGGSGPSSFAARALPPPSDARQS